MKAFTIAFEGSDGAGKDTQTALLETFLHSKGKKVGRISFPRYNQTLGGRILYDVLKGEDAGSYNFSKADPKIASFLYSMDRSESKPVIDQLIEDNDIVIFDRYVESNLLHQGGKWKTKEDRLEFADFLYDVEYKHLGLTKPDIIVYLSLPFEVSRKRADTRAKKYGGKLDAVEKDLDYVESGHNAGLFYADHFKWKVVPGTDSVGKEYTPQEVHENVKSILLPMLNLKTEK